MTQPLVSIGMPVRNGESSLDEAVGALRAQEFEDFELTIWDNASEDGTAEIAKHHAAEDPRVRYRRINHTIAVEENFINALQHAQGEYFMWAADDDVHEPGFIAAGLQALQDRPSAGMAFCEIANIDERGEVVRTYESFSRFASLRRRQRVARFTAEREDHGKANLVYSLFRREVCEAAAKASPLSARWGSDMAFVLAALARSDLCVTGERLFLKRVPVAHAEQSRVDAELLFLEYGGRQLTAAYAEALRGTGMAPIAAAILSARIIRAGFYKHRRKLRHRINHLGSLWRQL